MSSLLLALIVGFAVCQVATLVTTLYLHRTLSHRAVTMRPWLLFLFRPVLWMTTGIRPREWVAVHRKHHAYTDVEGDPHSPKLLGWTTSNWATSGCTAKSQPTPSRSVATHVTCRRPVGPGALRSSVAGPGHRHLLLVVVFGPRVGLLAAGIHAGSYLRLNAAVNAVTHTFGDRPYPNTATNLQWLALLTGRRRSAQQPPRRSDVCQVRVRTAAKSIWHGR